MKKTNSSDQRKQLQYCKQIERIMESVLGEVDWGDKEIECWIEEVLPNPNSSRLLVLLGTDWTPDFSPTDYLGILNDHMDLFKEEISVEAQRKKVPQLEFSFVPSHRFSFSPA